MILVIRAARNRKHTKETGRHGMGLSNEKWVDVDGVRTRYFEKGAGETVILLHGSYFGADFSAARHHFYGTHWVLHSFSSSVGPN